MSHMIQPEPSRTIHAAVASMLDNRAVTLIDIGGAYRVGIVNHICKEGSTDLYIVAMVGTFGTFCCHLPHA